MDLDISALKNAVSSLDEAVQVSQSDPSNKLIRDGMIQRFECTYELCHKMLRRYLEMTEPNAEEIDQMSFPNLIRTGSERGLLLNGWDIWNTYRDARNITSHVYDEKKAIKVCDAIPGFFEDANYLLNQLAKRISK